MLDLHKDSQKAFYMCIDVTVTFYVRFDIAGGETQLVTSTAQFLKPFLI